MFLKLGMFYAQRVASAFLFISSLPINRVLLAARFFVDRVIFGIYFAFVAELQTFEGVGREPSKVFYFIKKPLIALSG